MSEFNPTLGELATLGDAVIVLRKTGMAGFALLNGRVEPVPMQVEITFPLEGISGGIAHAVVKVGTRPRRSRRRSSTS